MRIILPVSEIASSSARNAHVAVLPHKAYISNTGYLELNARIPEDAIAQFNPQDDWVFWKNIDLININHQIAIAGDRLWCVSELDGAPSGCSAMLSTILPLFRGATGAVCSTYRIHFLVANIYAPSGTNANG